MEKYWRSLDELKNGPDKKSSISEEINHKNLVLDLADESISGATASRRDFLKLVGFSFATAAITSSCEKPVQKAIPYLIKPEEITPGKASFYATSFFDGSEYCAVVAKVRDGRPIKLEANKLSKVSAGGTSARVQASVLSLYDQYRLKEPSRDGKSVTWEELDQAVFEQLSGQVSGRKVLLTSTIISPSTVQLIKEMQQVYPALEWIVYDESPAYGLRKAHQDVFGEGFIPGYHFSQADYILSFDADFLGTWLAPVEFAAGYAKTREVTKEHPEMSKHVQFESGYSMTGSNADDRYPMSPGKWQAVLVKLYNAIAADMGKGVSAQGPDCDFDISSIKASLLANKGKSIVISSSNDPDIQKLVAGLNYMLGNYGSTLDTERTIMLKQGDDQEFAGLRKSLLNNEVSLLMLYNVNPVYSAREGNKLGDAVRAAGMSVYIGNSMSETAQVSHYIAPDHHYLEAWGDAEPVKGIYSLQQPTIHPLYDTRSFQDSLLTWSKKDAEYYDYLQEFWEEQVYSQSNDNNSFENWWNQNLQTGYFRSDFVHNAASSANLPDGIKREEAKGMALTVYTSVGVFDGRHANNPWLQELPDPVTKVCWDNFLAVSVADAAELGLEDEVIVEVNGLRVPVLVQPGQADGTCSIAMGYGRTVAGKVADNVGANAFSLVDDSSGFRDFVVSGVDIQKTGDKYELARTQTHNSMEGRPIVRETSLAAYKKDPSAGNHFHAEAEAHHDSMYPEKKFDGYHWGLAIDLNKCVGCNNCVVSCVAENNIATVGKEEVRNRRIMHWIRIDRYYSENTENPKTFHQPVMCQHCDNAPCENVCPVSATMHSNEGLNQVAYVRCIGTKYCINNCPYRVRRFNWYKYVNNDKFNYHLNDDTGKLVLNPDVTVRSRGVVEKCTFCVQRIQEKKLNAKLEGRTLADGEVQPACVQSCPTNALVFGNMNDKDSAVSRHMADERNYHLLEQLHTLPSVGYLTKVRNVEDDGLETSGEAHSEGHHS